MTYGQGLEQTVNDSRLWVNQLVNQTWSDAALTNLSQCGKNNHWIFLEAATALANTDYDVVIVAWSELARYNFQVGLELYSTDTMLRNQSVDINPQQTITGSWLEKIGDQLRKIRNDHWSILELIKYLNILHQLQVIHRGKQLFFVNTLMAWPPGYFDYKDFQLPSELSVFEQMMLQVETRSDEEVKKLYNKIHHEYRHYGTIQENHWLNLYQSFKHMQVDNVSETDRHPGYVSQDIFARYLMEKLNERM